MRWLPLRTPVVLALAAALAACGPQDLDPDSVDDDGDGFTANVDCNDADSSVNPGATEVCNGFDDDCDGTIDGAGASDAQRYFPDLDADGFGADGAGELHCRPPLGWVETEGDCDDDAITTFPGAVETCNGVDDDCSGVADDLPEATMPRWYRDADGDGFGRSDTETATCEPPPGSVERGGDCDDEAAATNPDAEERCNGLDDDCDGTVDLGAVDADRWYLDRDDDGFGRSDRAIIACGTPAFHAAVEGDCDDDDAEVFPGALEICNDGVDDDCNGLADDADDDLRRTTTQVFFPDGDDDGFGDQASGYRACVPTDVDDLSIGGDCDDADDEVFPGATEVCNTRDDDCDGDIDPATSVDATDWWLDDDEDGYGALKSKTRACEAPSTAYVDGVDPGDCNDRDDAIFPGATETCNDTDDDCDGVVDDNPPGAPTFYADDDDDGFGDPDTPLQACSRPTGYTRNDEDCDDDDDDINPRADEIWYDGVDQDCDGESDYDADGDGEDSEDETATGTDCDDDDPAIYAGAQEICDAGIDNDCDGLIDSADPSMKGNGTFYRDADADGYGNPSATTSSCVLATGWSRNDDDCLDVKGSSGPTSRVDPKNVNPAATEVCDNLVDDNCDGSANGCGLDDDYVASDADASYVGETAYDYLGGSLAPIGDIDDDGYPDFAVGAWGHDGGGSNAGRIYVIRGGPIEIDENDDEAANWLLDDLDDAFARFDGGAANDGAGRAMGPVGDLNGDGDADLAMAAPYAETGSNSSTGIVYLFFGPLTSGDYDLDSDEDVAIEGQDNSDLLGEFMTFGDLDDDGIDDLVLGARNAEQGTGASQGEVYVFTGSSTFSPTKVSDAEFTVRGEDNYEFAGSTARAADVDGDGAADLLVGAYGKSSYRGAVTVFTDTAAMSGGYTTDDHDARFLGSDISDYCGFGSPLTGSNGGLATADVDGDGYRDVAIGCRNGSGAGNRTFRAGDVFIVFGGTSIDDADDLDNDADLVWHGESIYNYLGENLVNAGDTNGDGVDELIVASSQSNSYRGVAWLVSLPTDETATTIDTFATASFTGNSASDLFSGAIAPVGDLNDDGYDDLVFGAYSDDDNGLWSGAAFLFLGTGL